MNIAELLRALADRLDQIESQSVAAVVTTAKPATAEVLDEPESNKWMSPNQQKIELIKKSVGVESEFNDSEEEDDLGDLRRRAGINTAAIHIASDDAPLE